MSDRSESREIDLRTYGAGPDQTRATNSAALAKALAEAHRSDTAVSIKLPEGEYDQALIQAELARGEPYVGLHGPNTGDGARFA